jgi:hypothetical protein
MKRKRAGPRQRPRRGEKHLPFPWTDIFRAPRGSIVSTAAPNSVGPLVPRPAPRPLALRLHTSPPPCLARRLAACCVARRPYPPPAGPLAFRGGAARAPLACRTCPSGAAPLARPLPACRTGRRRPACLPDGRRLPRLAAPWPPPRVLAFAPCVRPPTPLLDFRLRIATALLRLAAPARGCRVPPPSLPASSAFAKGAPPPLPAAPFYGPPLAAPPLHLRHFRRSREFWGAEFWGCLAGRPLAFLWAEVWAWRALGSCVCAAQTLHHAAGAPATMVICKRVEKAHRRLRPGRRRMGQPTALWRREASLSHINTRLIHHVAL